LKKNSPDTITYKDNSKALEQMVTLTSFDSGRRVIPSFGVRFSTVNQDSSFTLFSDSIPVGVSFSVPDSSNGLRDIKPIIPVSSGSNTVYIILAFLLLLLITAFFIRWYLQKRKSISMPVDHGLSPYNEAMAALASLAGTDKPDAAGIREIHGKLTAVFKRYLGRRLSRKMDSRTTSDLLVELSILGLPKNDISEQAMSMRCSDAVKFAKYLPPAGETEDCIQRTRETIHRVEQTFHPKL
jgi:hypothetical protein